MAEVENNQNNGAEKTNNNNNGAEKNNNNVKYSSFKPQLLIEAPKGDMAIQTYKLAFGAEEVSRTMHSKRKADQDVPLILNAVLKIGDAFFSLSECLPDETTKGKMEGSGGVVLCLETESEDLNKALVKASNAGFNPEGDMTKVEGVGKRFCKLKDPYGYIWAFSCTVKNTDVPADVEA